jgi:hypothetical protein
MQGAIGIIALFIAVPAGLVLTILPTIVAANRDHQNQAAILTLNLLALPLWLFAGPFSWQLLCICWVAAFVWACTSPAAVAVSKAVIRATTIAVIRTTTIAVILLAALATATAQAQTVTGPARVVDGDRDDQGGRSRWCCLLSMDLDFGSHPLITATGHAVAGIRHLISKRQVVVEPADTLADATNGSTVSEWLR